MTLRDPFQIRLAGSGGQGVILAGVLLAEAGMHDGHQVVNTQTYGPAARLGAAKSDVVLSRREIAFPEVTLPDVLVCLSREAYQKYGTLLAQGGLRIVDQGVALEAPVPVGSAVSLPIVLTARDLGPGGAVTANVVALGAIVALSAVVSERSLLQALRQRVKQEMLDLNRRALEAGLRLGAGATKEHDHREEATMTSIQIWLSRGDELAHQAQLQNKVWEELESEPLLDPSDLRVGVGKYVATLGGTVTSYPQKLAAEHAAKRVPGVQAVRNDIAVALPLLYQRTDEDLARAVDRALEWDVLVPAGRVTATVEAAWVRLAGSVECAHERIAAEEVVDRLIGVRGITNEIVVVPAAQPADLQARVEAALRRPAVLRGDHIKAEPHGNAVLLHGHVRSLAEREEAERSALSVPGVATVEDDLKVGS